LFRAFKYTVYALLSLNILIFWHENQLAALTRFPGGVPLANLIDTFAETIDTFAWVTLLLMFEFETSVFEQRPAGNALVRMLHGIRALCFALIVYAFYGYLTRAIADATDIDNILLWLDVVNSAVWLLVVLVLELDVRLQARGRWQDATLMASNALKPALYTLLLLAAIYWGIKGDFVDFWDAFLWLLAFVFIELNLFGWRRTDGLRQAS
jgi:hypothetical protein